MKVLISSSSFAEIDKEPLHWLECSDISVIRNPYGRRMTAKEMIPLVHDVDGIIAGLEPLTAEVLKSGKQLKAIARIGIGMDNVDLNAANKLGIKVSNTPEAPADAVAEMALTALLAILHQIVPANRDMHLNKWNRITGKSIIGLRVLIIGYGRIGRRFAELLEHMKAKVTIYDPYLPEFRNYDLEELVSNTDVISLHASGTDEILTSDLLTKMPNGVIVLNSARGGLVNEQTLFQKLKDGSVYWFWGDSFWEEPYVGMITQCDNALLTPHMSTFTEQCRTAMEIAAVKNLLGDLYHV